MKISLIPGFVSLALLAGPLQAQDKAALDSVSAVFKQIESGYKEWPHFSYSAENLEGGQSWQNHVWKSDGDTGFIKVESLNFDDHGESKTQFFFKGADLLFTLDRSETSRMEPKAPNVVTEKRYYFADQQLIRVLEKKGSFPAGKPTDTAALKNREVPPGELENAGETYTTQHEIAAAVIERVRHLEEEAPSGAAPADAPSNDTPWRVIAGSGSRDGHYALAWGFKDKRAIEGDTAEDGSLSVDPEAEGLVNYLINLRTKSIVGPLKGQHCGDKSPIGHSTSETAWSPASGFLAQINSGKWASWDATVYEVRDTDTITLSKGTDLLGLAKKAFFEIMADRPAFKKFDKDDFTLTLHEANFAQRGADLVLVVEVSAMIPKSDAEDSNFDITVDLKVESDETGAPKLASSARHPTE